MLKSMSNQLLGMWGSPQGKPQKTPLPGFCAACWLLSVLEPMAKGTQSGPTSEPAEAAGDLGGWGLPPNPSAPILGLKVRAGLASQIAVPLLKSVLTILSWQCVREVPRFWG